MPSNFQAILVSRDENKKQSVDIVEMRDDALMEGDVLVKVEHKLSIIKMAWQLPAGHRWCAVGR